MPTKLQPTEQERASEKARKERFLKNKYHFIPVAFYYTAFLVIHRSLNVVRSFYGSICLKKEVEITKLKSI